MGDQKGAVYGKCVAANYQNASKDMCAREFMVLKNCYLVTPAQVSLVLLASCD